MIKHIVFFRIKGDHTPLQRKALAERLAGIFEPLATHPAVAEYRTGVNINGSDSSWDVAIDSIFESPEKLEEYQVSREHTEAKKEAAVINKEKAVIDYEIHDRR